MHKCITNKSSGMSNKKLFFQTVSDIFKAAPYLLLIVLFCELFIGLLQTGALIAWEYLVNMAEQFIRQRDNYAILIVALILSLVSYVAMDFVRMILESLYTLLNNRLSESFQSRLYDKCRVIGAIHFEDSDLYNEIDRANRSINGIISLVGIIGIFVMAFSRIVTLGTYVLFEKPIFAFIVVLPIVPILLTRMIRGKDLYNLNYSQSEKRRECNYYRSCVSGKETKTALAESYFIKKWDNLYCEINAKEKKVNRKLSFVFAFLNILKYAVYVIAIILAAVYLFDGSIDLGMFALITGMLGTTHATIEVVVSKSGDIAGSLRYAKDYYNFLNKSDDMVKSKNKFEYGIRLEDVSFSYPKSNGNTLHNINLTIKRGEKIALVGANGAGKTTLAKLILGFYNPSQGQVLFDDNIRSNNTLADASAVFQSFCKYFFTLRENVAFGNISEIDHDTELLDRLKEFDFDLSKVNFSLDTQLGREFEGVELSGGEWQKIALARGFLKESDFIILDEPNSGLDPLTESKLFQCFIGLLKNCTGIIITHRIGIASLADRIVLLENGQIAEEGTHAQLMDKRGQYFTMFEAQATMYK